MATASAGLGTTQGGRKGKLSPEDEQILQQPYTEAVKFMGYVPEVIVYAVKLLQINNDPIHVQRILLEADKLTRLKTRGEDWPPIVKRPPPQPFDGESETDSDSDSDEFVDAQLPDQDDFHTDGDQAGLQHMNEAIIASGPAERTHNKNTAERTDNTHTADNTQSRSTAETQNRNTSEGTQNTDVSFLHRKLKALRHENQLLKARQQCKSCHNRPVSITFLPCGHYSYCYECGQRFGSCPICRKTILADVKTFLA